MAIHINGVTISTGNRKLGGIPSVSLAPYLSCGKGCGPLKCMKHCYARKMQKYTSVLPGWEQNYRIWKKDPETYFTAIREFLFKKNPDRFRWHIGGDIPSEEYSAAMWEIADAFPDIRFLCFTKAYRFLSFMEDIDNLTLIVSRWPGMPIGDRDLSGFAQAWMRESGTPTEGYEIPEAAEPCPGSCATCNRCWGLKPGQHVVFEQH